MEEYRSGLSLEAVGQPTIAVGMDRFGPAVGGGLSFSFGDMLGDQSLVAAVQLNSGLSNNFSVKNTGAQVSYLNRAHRWNWGLVGGQMPYLSGGAQQGVGSLNGEPAQFNQSVIFRQTERSGAGVVAYPFNRAQRVEFQAGVSQIVFDQVVRTTAFSLRTGQLLADETDETSLGRQPVAGHIVGGARVRHDELRRDEPGSGAEIPPRGVAHVRVGAVYRCAGGLPAVLHAGVVLHLRDPGHALRPLRQRKR